MKSEVVAPVVGMGATAVVGSDSYPYTIVQVDNSRRVWVSRDNYKRIDSNGLSEHQEYEYTPASLTLKIAITLRKDGKWRVQGLRRTGSYFVIGVRRAYRDPSF